MTKEFLSKYISRQEFERSTIAVRNGLANQLHGDLLDNAKHLCRTVIDAIRDYYKAPVFVTSGYRSETVNRLAGGSVNSQHVKGEAIDFTVKGVSVKKVFGDIISGDIKGNDGKPLQYDQVIDEFGSWIHISYKAFRTNRNEALRAHNNGQGTRYVKIQQGRD